jgi:hypothetical protein
MNCNLGKFKGSDFKLLMVEEDGLGVIKTGAPVYNFPYKSIDLKMEKKIVESELIKGGRKASQPKFGFSETNGKVEVGVDTKNAGFLFKTIFGNYTGAVDAGTKKEHSFTIGDCLPYFSLFKYKLGNSYRYLGSKAKSLDIKFGEEGELVASVEIESAGEAMAATTGLETGKQVQENADVGATSIKVDNSGIETGDTIAIATGNWSIASDVQKYSEEIVLTDATGLAEGDFISISGENFVIGKINGNTIVLTRPIFTNVASGTSVQVVNSYTVAVVGGTDTVNLAEGLKHAVTANASLVFTAVNATEVGEVLEGVKVKITTGLDSFDAVAKDVSFSFDNSTETERYLNGQGNVGSITEGITKSKLSMKLTMDAENAKVLEMAKVGLDASVTITCISTNGDKLVFEMPTARITPTSAPISGAGLLSVDTEMIPYGDITVKLLNDVESY